MKPALIAAALFLAVGCAGSPAEIVQSKPSAAPVSRHCADLVAQAMASPEAPVAGVMACFDSQITDSANQSGIYDDTDFQQQVAGQPPVFNSATYCGVAHDGAYVYAMASTDGSDTGRVAVTVNRSDGLVNGVQTQQGAGCPSGLR